MTPTDPSDQRPTDPVEENADPIEAIVEPDQAPQPATDQRQDSTLPRQPQPRDLRDLLRAAVRRPSREQLMVGLLLGLLGFAAVTQVNSNSTNDRYSGLRSSELVQVLNGLTVEERRASDELNRLERTRDQLRDSTRRRAAAIAQAREESQTLGILAGTVPAQGPGIRITVEDPQGSLTLNNLLNGIEELRDAGAEVIEVNDSVRVVAQTWFENAEGGGILVDGVRLRAPYVLDVIGNPETMARALNIAGGFIDDVNGDGGSVDITTERTVTIRSVVPEETPDFAEGTGGQ